MCSSQLDHRSVVPQASLEPTDKVSRVDVFWILMYALGYLMTRSFLNEAR